MPASTSIPTVDLHDGTTIPQLGFGTFKVPPEETEETVLAALDVGYRHIDTAQMYGNEAGVGAALHGSGIARDDVYVTTKLGNDKHRPEHVERSFDESLERLGLDRLDLFLIHWPLPTRYDGDFVSTWKAMTALLGDGRLTSVGVSNFEPDFLDRIIDATGVVPVVNQIEVQPFFTNEAARAASHRHGIKVEAWSPIARGQVDDEPVIQEIAEKHGKTPAQVTLRWHIERGDIVFPKSMHRERMEQNLAIFDFSLAEEEVRRIASLDRGDPGRTGPNPNVMDVVPS